ncbi:MAG: hypothetical protein J6S67_00635, partial [Methanobrevibacter sp.]|nr:hypothetical protein [Methanobrevibacter sp.]
GIRIIPQAKVTELQAKSITNNVIRALLKSFNAKNVNFGEAASYDAIYDTIMGADPSIKSVVLDDIVYTTRAYYFEDADTLKYVEINGIPKIDGVGYLYNNDIYSDSEHTTQLSPPPTNGKVYYDLYTNTCIKKANDTWSTSLRDSFKVEIFAKSVLNGNTQLLVKDEKFDYSLDQIKDSEIDDIVSITTNTTLTCNPTATLLDNEGVIVYVPSYQTVEEYSTYVKVLTNFDIQADTLTTIPSGKWVIIYWREENGNDAPYHYRKIDSTEEVVIQSTVDIGSGWSNDGPPVDGKTGIVTDPTTIQKIYLGKEPYNNTRTLSGSQSVSVEKKISVTLNNSDGMLYYFVLNNKKYSQVNDQVTEKYVLFNESSDSEQSYILQTGEYLFYTSSSMRELNILSAGTRIVREKTAGADSMDELSCNVTDISSLREKGATSIEDFWVTIPNTYSLTLQEMKYYGVSGEGSSIRVSGEYAFKEIDTSQGEPRFTATLFSFQNPSANSGDLTLISINASYVNTTTFTGGLWIESVYGEEAKYYHNDDGEWQETSFVPSDNYDVLRVSGEVSLSAENTIATIGDGSVVICEAKLNTGMVFSDGGTPEKYYESTMYNYGISFVINNTVTPVPAFLSITLYYEDGSTSVPGSTLNDRYIKSTLLYKSSPTSPMVLEDSRQSVTFTDASSSVPKTGNSSSPLYILSDYEYDLDGGIDVNVQRLTISGDVENMSVYVYTISPFTDGITMTSEGISIPYTSEDVGDEKSITFRIPEGDYIIPLINNTSVFSSVSVSIDGGEGPDTPVADITGNDDFSSAGTYFLKFHSTGASDVQLNFSVAGTISGTYTLTVGNPYKYEGPSNFDANTYTAILNKVIYLDSAKKFDYIYQVPVDDEIEDPLDGESFVNEKHCYNPYTICQIDTESFKDNVKVLNIKK